MERHASLNGLDFEKIEFSYPPVQTTMDKCGFFVLAILKMQDDPKLEIADVAVEEENTRGWLAVDLHRARKKPIPPRKQQLTCDVVYGQFIR
jgi:hypothetical protein